MREVTPGGAMMISGAVILLLSAGFYFLDDDNNAQIGMALGVLVMLAPFVLGAIHYLLVRLVVRIIGGPKPHSAPRADVDGDGMSPAVRAWKEQTERHHARSVGGASRTIQADDVRDGGAR